MTITFASWTCGLAQAAQIQSSDDRTETPKSGSITGGVVNESGQPLANAAVSVRAFGSVGPGNVTTTDAEGNFQVAGLDPVAYQVSAVIPAYTAEDVLRLFALMVSNDGSFALNNLPPGRYWAIAKTAGQNESNVISRLRLPDEAEARVKLRQEVEAAKTEIELKPCQNVTNYSLPFMVP